MRNAWPAPSGSFRAPAWRRRRPRGVHSSSTPRSTSITRAAAGSSRSAVPSSRLICVGYRRVASGRGLQDVSGVKDLTPAEGVNEVRIGDDPLAVGPGHEVVREPPCRAEDELHHRCSIAAGCDGGSGPVHWTHGRPDLCPLRRTHRRRRHVDHRRDQAVPPQVCSEAATDDRDGAPSGLSRRRPEVRTKCVPTVRNQAERDAMADVGEGPTSLQ